MAGTINFTLEDFQNAARKYRKELLYLPIIGIQDTLKFMTGRPGIRYQEAVGTLTGTAQFAPYKTNRSHDFDATLNHRILETFFGCAVEKFEPNSLVSTLLGAMGATKGDGQRNAPSAKHVLALIARELSEHLNMAIFSAVRNANGDTTQDLFNGFDTITAAEITAGNIAAANKNYLKFDEVLSTANAVDLMKSALYKLDPKLRAKTLYAYCSQDIVDKYNESYLLTHAATPYNNQFQQTVVEGSAGKLIFCPLASKAGSKFIHITDKANMLVGYDQMGDVESIEVERFAPFVLDYIATMFFGVQFEQIEKERMMVVELTEGEEEDDTPDGDLFTPVADPTGKNPTTEGWYESDGAGGYTLSDDTEPGDGVTYYVKS